MAFKFALGNDGYASIQANNSTDVIFKFKQFMVTVGWKVSASGDGYITYDPFADVITHSSTGVGGLANQKSWFVLEHKTNGRAFLFQRGDADNKFKLKYSVTSFNDSSGASSDITPKPLDGKEIILAGAGTDVAPSFEQIFKTQNTNIRCHFLAQVSDSFYGIGWAMFGNSAGQNSMSFMHAFDPMLSSYAEDKDPYVIYIDKSTNIGSISAFNTPDAKIWAYYRKDYTTDELATTIQGFEPSANGFNIVSSLPTSPYTGKDGTVPVIYARRINASQTQLFPSGIKGQSTLFKWHLQSRNNYFLFSLRDQEYRVVVGNVSLPWNGDPIQF